MAEMISDRYFSRDRVRISFNKVVWPEALIPVLRRFMKAVFFLREESREGAAL